MALGTAEAAYGKLGLAMERFAGSRDDRLKELATARAASDDGLPGQAKKLTVLAASWLKLGTPFLLKTSHLTSALLAEVRAAFDALANAGATAVVAGPAVARYTPAVNVKEGAVLEEMLRARDDVEAARKECPVIERLVPGKATRSVLGNHTKKAAAPAPVPVDGATPAVAGGK